MSAVDPLDRGSFPPYWKILLRLEMTTKFGLHLIYRNGSINRSQRKTPEYILLTARSRCNAFIKRCTDE